MDIVMVMSIQRCNRNVRFTTSSRRWYSGVVPTLRPLCEGCEMLTIHDNLITLQQPCLKVVKKFNNNMTLVRVVESGTVGYIPNWENSGLNPMLNRA